MHWKEVKVVIGLKDDYRDVGAIHSVPLFVLFCWRGFDREHFVYRFGEVICHISLLDFM
jgi:hypothetical protein